MSLVAYYDESGTHDASTVTVLAGFAARPNEWALFEREWTKILKKWNLPFIHAKHLFHRQKLYKNWKRKHLAELWADLLYVIQEREIFGTKTVLYEDHYTMFYKMEGPFGKPDKLARGERLDSRYALCFRSLLHSLPSSYRVHQDESDFRFVLEAGHRNAGDASRVFGELKGSQHYDYRSMIGEAVSFATKPEFCALQAADLLAYWCFKTENYVDDDDERGMHINDFEREILDCRLPLVEHLITPEDLKTLRQNFFRKRKLPVFQQIRLDDYTDDIDLSELIGAEFHLGRRFTG